MVLTWKRMALSSVAAGLLVGGGWLWLQEASAAAYPRPGTVFNCQGIRPHNIRFNQGLSFDAVTQGAIQAVAGETTTTADGRERMQLTVTDTATEGYVEGIGPLQITMDKNKPAVPSSLTANQKEAPFPATQTMRFYPQFNLNGEVFSATTPVHVVNSSVKSFPPEPGTVYVLTNEVVLESEKGNTISLTPGRAFTITGSN